MNIIKNIQLNNKICLIKESLFNNDKPDRIKKIFTDILPLLSLHTKTAKFCHLGIFVYRITEFNWKAETSKSLCQMAALVAYMGFATLAPKANLAFVTVYHIYKIVKTDDNYTKKISRIAHELLYLSSIYYSAPTLIAASLICQAWVEINQATKDLSQAPSSLKEIVNFIVGFVRLYGLIFEARKVYETVFTKKLVEGITLSYDNLRPSNTIYKNCLFSEHLFDNIEITNTIFNNCSFEPLTIRKSSNGAIRAIFTNVTFKKCDFSYRIFTRCVFKNSEFNSCNFFNSMFNRSNFINAKITSSCLENACFLENQIQGSLIKGCDLLNVLLLQAWELFKFEDCTDNQFSKPIIIIPVKFDEELPRFAPAIIECIRLKGGLVLPFDVSCTDIHSKKILEKEVVASLSDIPKTPSSSILSLPDELLKRAQLDSQLNRIKEKAASFIFIAHGLVLPGGNNIEREFYQRSLSPIVQNKDYHRTLTEFALLQLANDQNKAIFGICRGNQLINIFFGGDLRDVDDQWGSYQELRLADTPAARQFKKESQLNHAVFAYSCHRQAINTLGQGIEVVLKNDDNIIKLVLGKEGRIIGCQYHPEQLLYNPTKELYEIGLKETKSKISADTHDLFTQSSELIYELFLKKIFQANIPM